MAEYLTGNILAALNAVRHGFFTRRGGKSEGLYAGLNVGLGSGDDLKNVHENRARCMQALAAPENALVTVCQVHGTDVARVDKPWPVQAAPRADALVSNRPDVVLGILTADCTPILFADPGAGVVGAAHAGWKGAFAGVARETVLAMEKLGASRQRIRAVIGPCIGQNSYEVGPEFPAAFLAQDSANSDFFKPAAKSGHHMFNIAGYNRRQLEILALDDIEIIERDTCAEPEFFFSYRRATLAGAPDYGRQLSAIQILD